MSDRINALAEKIDSLDKERTGILNYFGCDNGGISKIKKNIAQYEAELKKVSGIEESYSKATDKALREYAELKEQAKEFDPAQLYEARQEIRPEMEQEAIKHLQETHGNKFRESYIPLCQKDAARLMNEDAEKRSVRETIRQRQREIEMQKREQTNERQIPKRKTAE